MFSDRQMEVHAAMDDLDREAMKVMLRSEARRLAPTKDRPKGVRFGLPEWLKRAPVVLRVTHR